MSISEIENMLIKSVHSDKNAEFFFTSNIHNEEVFYDLLEVVEKSNSGDARMEGAYYLSAYDENLLIKEENRLLSLMDDEWDSVAVHIMIALSRIKSAKALVKIIQNRIRPTLGWEAQALENYIKGVADE